jgi:hypothetical protein
VLGDSFRGSRGRAWRAGLARESRPGCHTTCLGPLECRWDLLNRIRKWCGVEIYFQAEQPTLFSNPPLDLRQYVFSNAKRGFESPILRDVTSRDWPWILFASTPLVSHLS